MNSHVSVEEQEEVSLDEFDSFIFSASNINQGGVDSDRSEKDTIFYNNEFFSAPGVTIEPVLPDNLSLNTINHEYENTGQLNCISKRTKKRVRKKGGSNVQFKPSLTHVSNASSVNSSSIPLEPPFMNLSDKLSSPEIPIEVDLSQQLFSDSDDNSNDSFNGFSDLSNTSFEGFLNKSTDFGNPNSFQLTPPLESIEKTSRPRSGSVIREISNSFGKYQVKCSSKTDSNSSILFNNSDISASFSKSHQNYFEGPFTPFYSSTFKKFKKETDASRRMYKESKKEDLKSFNPERVKRKNDSSEQDLALNSSLGIFALNDDSDTESFEGFSVLNQDEHKLDHVSSNLLSQMIEEPDQSNIPIAPMNDDFSEENKNGLGTIRHDLGQNDLQIRSDDLVQNENDFIGDHCNRIGCTISWLETGMGRTNSVQITNGVVFELSEFAKKIAWEPTYIAIWILRLRSYINIEVVNDDMKKINSVIKRRKSLSVTFAGYANLKTKLKSFDSELFSLPSAERLDKERSKLANNTSKNNSSKKNNRSLPNNSRNSKTKEAKKKVSLSTINSIPKKINDVKFSETDENLFDNSDSDLIFSDDELNSYYKEFNNPENESASLYDESNSSSSLFEKENIKDKSLYLENKDFSNKSSKGRIRKPTVKAQQLYALRSSCETGDSSNDEIALNKNLNQTKNFREKLLIPIFVDNGQEIGPHCTANSIDIKLLNSFNETNIKITNGVVYELYQFFRERKASLTALVHTLYLLSNVSIEKSNIIPTMAKMHGLVKVLWAENIVKNPRMPYDEFEFPHSCIKRSSLEIEPLSNNNHLSKIEKSENRRLRSKKLRLGNENKILTTSPAPMDLESGSSNLFSDTSTYQSNHSESKETGPMSNTFGYEGKITRGDIVYLYTKWLKKKMESQTNVFVTDLSKDVEALIISRKVDFIRVPVGTLMSSSVKLFEEFRKLSKSSMQEAKAYLLEDWIDDIKSILSSIMKNSNSNDEKEILKGKMQPKIMSKDTEHSNRTNEQHITIASKNVSLPCSNEASDSIHYPNKNTKYSQSNKINQIEMSESIIDDLYSATKMEKIVGYRIVKTGEENVTEYRLRWVGLPSSQDSWVNEDELDCPDILAEFWDALIKQRASRGGPLPNIRKELMLKPPLKEQNKLIPPESLVQEDKNLLPFFGMDKSSSSKFFDLMVKSLQINLVDSQHEEEKVFVRRVKVTKGEILNLYNTWRHNNQKRLLAGSNKKLDVSILIDQVKSLMEDKRVRNFNPSCLLDLCYRMSLMQAKLEDPKKVQEYLSEDFMELLQVGQKHQDAVRRENELCLKKIKYNVAISTENQKLIEKINCLNNLERESLIIAKFMQKNKFKSNLVKELQGEIDAMKKILEGKPIESLSIENVKKQNPNTIKELDSLGVKEDILNKILNIALNIE